MSLSQIVRLKVSARLLQGLATQVRAGYLTANDIANRIDSIQHTIYQVSRTPKRSVL